MTSLVATAMVMGIIFDAGIFVGFYILQGGQTFVQVMTSGAGLSPYMVLALPIFVPLIEGLTFDGPLDFPGVDPDRNR